MKLLVAPQALLLAIALAGPAAADCANKVTAPLSYMSENSETHRVLGRWFEQCPQIKVTVSRQPLLEKPDVQDAPEGQAQIAGVSNRTLPALLDAGAVRPLNDLVDAYGGSLDPRQLIRAGDDVVAIALSYNATQLVYRQDVLTKLDIAPPQTWDDLLRAADRLRTEGEMAYPLGIALGRGWNLGFEFSNHFLANGGQFFDEKGSPTLNSSAGLAALRTLSMLTEYMAPGYLESSPNTIRERMRDGDLAFAIDWSDLGGPRLEEKEAIDEAQFATAPVPARDLTSPASTTLWWDGVAFSSTLPDEEAVAAFQAVIVALSDETLDSRGKQSIWLSPGYRADAKSTGLEDTFKRPDLPPTYPSRTDVQLLHAMAGSVLPAYFEDHLSAEDALVAVEQAYVAYISGETDTETE